MDLTDSETTVVQCLAQGMQSKEIAEQLGRSKATVEGHIRILFAKLHARSRAHIVAIAMGSINGS